MAPTLSKPIEPLEPRDYTPQDLKKYNGIADPHILMAVKGKVYDVTAGSMFYGPRQGNFDAWASFHHADEDQGTI